MHVSSVRRIHYMTYNFFLVRSSFIRYYAHAKTEILKKWTDLISGKDIFVHVKGTIIILVASKGKIRIK